MSTLKVTSESIAVASTVVGLVWAVAWPFGHESSALGRLHEDGARTITLTGVAATGTWTESAVTGSNYWRGDFPPARPALKVGEPVALRLRSSDVIHMFYCPELGVGPIEVYPGHLVTVQFTPRETGVFEYYCTIICGDPHFGMRGEIVVTERGEEPPPPAAAASGPYWLEPPSEFETRVELGGWLFRKRGCGACHGEEGKGGVANFNFPSGFVTRLDSLAEKIGLFEPEEVEAFVTAIEGGRKPDDIEEFPPEGDLEAALDRYHETVELIRRGRTPAKRDLSGPQPPLDMPAWKDRLSDADIDAIIAYLLTLQPWD